MIGEASLARRPGVPAHERFVFADKAHKYAIAVFCINEGERVRAQLTRMAPLADVADIIVADGGSTDNSLTRGTLGMFRLRALLVKKDMGKLSAQMRMALAWALDAGYEGIVVIDGNNKDDPAAIPDFVAALDAGVDHVQGSRFITGGREINTPPSRLLGLKLLHAPLISLASGTRQTDTTNGFRAYSRRLLLDARVLPFRNVFTAYELHYYLAIRAARLGYRLAEVPVTRAYPATGKTPTKISPIRGNLKILRTLFNAVRHAYDPPAGGAP